MILDLDKQDLITLVKGSEPNYSAMDHYLVKASGQMMGAPGEKWQWNEHVLENFSKNELLVVYQVCKESWRKEEDEDE